MPESKTEGEEKNKESAKIELRQTVIEDLSVMYHQVMLSYFNETGIKPTQAEVVHAIGNMTFHWGKITAKKELKDEQAERIESGRGMVCAFGAGG